MPSMRTHRVGLKGGVEVGAMVGLGVAVGLAVGLGVTAAVGEGVDVTVGVHVTTGLRLTNSRGSNHHHTASIAAMIATIHTPRQSLNPGSSYISRTPKKT